MRILLTLSVLISVFAMPALAQVSDSTGPVDPTSPTSPVTRPTMPTLPGTEGSRIDVTPGLDNEGDLSRDLKALPQSMEERTGTEPDTLDQATHRLRPDDLETNRGKERPNGFGAGATPDTGSEVHDQIRP
ncbi:hypothetical protein ACI2KR_21100 [Pseudomonas luteola]